MYENSVSKCFYVNQKNILLAVKSYHFSTRSLRFNSYQPKNGTKTLLH